MYYESIPNEHFHTKTHIYNNSMRNECREEEKKHEEQRRKKTQFEVGWFKSFKFTKHMNFVMKTFGIAGSNWLNENEKAWNEPQQRYFFFSYFFVACTLCK